MEYANSRINKTRGGQTKMAKVKEEEKPVKVEETEEVAKEEVKTDSKPIVEKSEATKIVGPPAIDFIKGSTCFKCKDKLLEDEEVIYLWSSYCNPVQARCKQCAEKMEANV